VDGGIDGGAPDDDAGVDGGEEPSAECGPATTFDFEAQPLNQPIGTGGPASGQPVSDTSGATVVEGEMTGRSLRFEHHLSAVKNTRFEYLGGAATEGRLVVELDVRVETVGQAFGIYHL